MWENRSSGNKLSIQDGQVPFLSENWASGKSVYGSEQEQTDKES